MFFSKRMPARGNGALVSTAKLWARRLAPLALLLPVAANAAGDCAPDQALCIKAVPSAAYTDLHAVNQESFPITLKLSLMPVNMTAVDEPPQQWVLQPGESAQLMRLRVADPGKPWDYRYRMSWARGDYRVVHDDSHVYALPYLPGTTFLVSQGYNGHYSHHGDSSYAIDFAMPEGTPIVAAREGQVVSVRADSNVGGPDRAYEDKANYIVIQHDDGSFAEYLHLRYQGVTVQEGERVQRGQLIGYSGNTGFSGGPHLHFMVAGATAEGGRRSFPLRFNTSEGTLAELRTGQRYMHAADEALISGTDAPAAAAAVGSGEPQVAQ
jgi:hypothetical protein